MHVRRLTIENIRSIQRFDLDLSRGDPSGWHVILGDNGAGKSTVVRALALALMGPSNAHATRQDWSRWLAAGSTSGHVTVAPSEHDQDRWTVGGGPGRRWITAKANIRSESGGSMQNGPQAAIEFSGTACDLCFRMSPKPCPDNGGCFPGSGEVLGMWTHPETVSDKSALPDTSHSVSLLLRTSSPGAWLRAGRCAGRHPRGCSVFRSTTLSACRNPTRVPPCGTRPRLLTRPPSAVRRPAGRAWPYARWWRAEQRGPRRHTR